MVDIRSAVSMLSFSRMAIPCSGPRGPFALRSASSESAMAKASGLSSMMALTAGPCLSSASIRSRYISVSDRALIAPEFIFACSSMMLISSITYARSFKQRRFSVIFVRVQDNAPLMGQSLFDQIIVL